MLVIFTFIRNKNNLKVQQPDISKPLLYFFENLKIHFEIFPCNQL
jgi:hypothetical protein